MPDKIEFVLNKNTGVVHKRINGATPEPCNVDQIQDKLVVEGSLPKHRKLCSRCFHKWRAI